MQKKTHINQEPYGTSICNSKGLAWSNMAEYSRPLDNALKTEAQQRPTGPLRCHQQCHSQAFVSSLQLYCQEPKTLCQRHKSSCLLSKQSYRRAFTLTVYKHQISPQLLSTSPRGITVSRSYGTVADPKDSVANAGHSAAKRHQN